MGYRKNKKGTESKGYLSGDARQELLPPKSFVWEKGGCLKFSALQTKTRTKLAGKDCWFT